MTHLKRLMGLSLILLLIIPAALAQSGSVALATSRIEEDPTNASLYIDRGLAYEDIDDNESALADYTQAIELDDSNELGYYFRGVLNATMGNYEASVTDLNESVRLCTSECEYNYHNRGYAYYYLENYDAALKDFDTALELRPTYSVAQYFRGLVFFDTGAYEQAIVTFDASLETCEEECQYDYYYRGLSRENLGQYEAAVLDYTQAIAIDPDYTLAYYVRGVSQYVLGDFEAAQADLEVSLASCEIDCDYDYNYLGLAQYKQGNHTEALENIGQAITLYPNEPAYIKNRGQVYHQLERYDDALSDYATAIEDNPDFPYTYFERGITHLAMGNEALAVEDFNTARKLDLDYTTAWEYERVLEIYETYSNRDSVESVPSWMTEHISDIETKLEELRETMAAS